MPTNIDGKGAAGRLGPWFGWKTRPQGCLGRGRVLKGERGGGGGGGATGKNKRSENQGLERSNMVKAKETKVGQGEGHPGRKGDRERGKLEERENKGRASLDRSPAS